MQPNAAKAPVPNNRNRPDGSCRSAHKLSKLSSFQAGSIPSSQCCTYALGPTRFLFFSTRISAAVSVAAAEASGLSGPLARSSPARLPWGRPSLLNPLLSRLSPRMSRQGPGPPFQNFGKIRGRSCRRILRLVPRDRTSSCNDAEANARTAVVSESAPGSKAEELPLSISSQLRPPIAVIEPAFHHFAFGPITNSCPQGPRTRPNLVRCTGKAVSAMTRIDSLGQRRWCL
jgi:hypothetical protein